MPLIRRAECCGALTWGGGRWCRPWWWGRTPGRTCWWRAACWGCWSLRCSQHRAGYWAKAKGVYAQVLSMSRLDLQTLGSRGQPLLTGDCPPRVGTNLLFARTRGAEELGTGRDGLPRCLLSLGLRGAGVLWCLICSRALTLSLAVSGAGPAHTQQSALGTAATKLGSSTDTFLCRAC